MSLSAQPAQRDPSVTLWLLLLYIMAPYNAVQVIKESGAGAGTEPRPFFDFLEGCLRHKVPSSPPQGQPPPPEQMILSVPNCLRACLRAAVLAMLF